VYSHLGAFIIITIIINIFVKRHRQSYRGASNTYHTVNTKRYPSSQNEKIIINILLIRGILVRVILYPDMLYVSASMANTKNRFYKFWYKQEIIFHLHTETQGNGSRSDGHNC